MGYGSLRIPYTGGPFLDTLEKADIVTPGQMSDKLSDNLLVGPRISEPPHAQQVGSSKAPEFRELPAQISRKFLRYTRSPTG